MHGGVDVVEQSIHGTRHRVGGSFDVTTGLDQAQLEQLGHGLVEAKAVSNLATGTAPRPRRPPSGVPAWSWAAMACSTRASACWRSDLPRCAAARPGPCAALRTAAGDRRLAVRRRPRSRPGAAPRWATTHTSLTPSHRRGWRVSKRSRSGPGGHAANDESKRWRALEGLLGRTAATVTRPAYGSMVTRGRRARLRRARQPCDGDAGKNQAPAPSTIASTTDWASRPIPTPAAATMAAEGRHRSLRHRPCWSGQGDQLVSWRQSRHRVPVRPGETCGSMVARLRR